MYPPCPFCGAEVYRDRQPNGEDICLGPDRHHWPQAWTDSRRPLPKPAPLDPGVIHITCTPDQISVERHGKKVQLPADYFDKYIENVRSG